MRIEYLPTEYLVYVVVVRGDARSPKTWIAKAYAMLPFLNFMDEQGFSISDPTEEQLAHYRNSLEGKGITRDRIARVMNVICEFYEWLDLDWLRKRDSWGGGTNGLWPSCFRRRHRTPVIGPIRSGVASTAVS